MLNNLPNTILPFSMFLISTVNSIYGVFMPNWGFSAAALLTFGAK